MATSKALAAWMELNDRQQGTLAAILEAEQEIEKDRGRAAARGDFDATPAAIWRRIDFSRETGDRSIFGWTDLQMKLSHRGWDNQGNGATMAALAARGLITQDSYGSGAGWMSYVMLTRQGRAAARAGTTLRPGPAPKDVLSQRTWEVLALLWSADLRGEPLKWRSSRTIDVALIEKHVPPLAAQLPGWGEGYQITARGRDFYREHYATHVAAYPDVRALHPDGAEADPWPQANEILARHQGFYLALSEAWRQATADQRAASREAGTEPADVDPVLPKDVAKLVTARRKLWKKTADQRAALAGSHVADLQTRAERAARAYAVAALTAFNAAVTGADPRTALQEMSEPAAPADDWDEARLTPPAATAIHAIDTEAKKLHGQAVGAPVRRRGPAPTRRRSRWASSAEQPPSPGSDLISLADFLREHTASGALARRLHPPT